MIKDYEDIKIMHDTSCIINTAIFHTFDETLKQIIYTNGGWFNEIPQLQSKQTLGYTHRVCLLYNTERIVFLLLF